MCGSVKRDVTTTQQRHHRTALQTHLYVKNGDGTSYEETTESNTDLVVQIVDRVEVGVDLLQQVAQRQVLTQLH